MQTTPDFTGKTFLLWVILLCITTGFLACKKRTNTDYLPVNPEEPCLPYSQPTERIKKIITEEGGHINVTLCYYDSLKRLRHTYDSGEYSYHNYYWYTPQRVYFPYQESDSTSGPYIELDSNGYAIQNDMGIFRWSVKPDGYLAWKSTSFPHAGTTTIQYFYHCYNNNRCKGTVSSHPGSVPQDPSYTNNTFFEDKLNTIGNENMGISYYGKQNNCLLKAVYAETTSGNELVENYEYSFDSLERVTKEIRILASGVTRIRYFWYY